MSKNKNNTPPTVDNDEELFEQVDAGDEDLEPTEDKAVQYKIPPKDNAVHVEGRGPFAFSNPVRNLTNEAIVATMRANKAAELQKIPEEETVRLALPSIGADGKRIKDANGYLVIEDRVVLKREKVARDWDERIQRYVSKNPV